MAIGYEYVAVVRKWKTLTTTKEVERFFGFDNYHRASIKDYAKIAGPLHRLTGKRPHIKGP